MFKNPFFGSDFKWLFFLEKVVALFLLFIGITNAYFFIKKIPFFTLEWVLYSWNENLYLSNFTLLSIYSGIFIFFNKRLAWIGGLGLLITMFFGAIYAVICTKYGALRVDTTLEDFLILLVLNSFLIVCINVLTRKEIRAKYVVSKKHYLLVGIIVVTFTVIRLFEVWNEFEIKQLMSH